MSGLFRNHWFPVDLCASRPLAPVPCIHYYNEHKLPKVTIFDSTYFSDCSSQNTPPGLFPKPFCGVTAGHAEARHELVEHVAASGYCEHTSLEEAYLHQMLPFDSLKMCSSPDWLTELGESVPDDVLCHLMPIDQDVSDIEAAISRDRKLCTLGSHVARKDLTVQAELCESELSHRFSLSIALMLVEAKSKLRPCSTVVRQFVVVLPSSPDEKLTTRIEEIQWIVRTITPEPCFADLVDCTRRSIAEKPDVLRSRSLGFYQQRAGADCVLEFEASDVVFDASTRTARFLDTRSLRRRVCRRMEHVSNCPSHITADIPFDLDLEVVSRACLLAMARRRRLGRWLSSLRLRWSCWWRGLDSKSTVLLSSSHPVPTSEDDNRIVVNRVAKVRVQAQLRIVQVYHMRQLVRFPVIYDLGWLTQLQSSFDYLGPCPTREALIGLVKGMSTVNVPMAVHDQVRYGTVLMYFHERGVAQAQAGFRLGPGHESLA
jgi:hypothetical protein